MKQHSSLPVIMRQSRWWPVIAVIAAPIKLVGSLVHELIQQTYWASYHRELEERRKRSGG